MNIQTDRMLETATQACELLKVLSNPHRLLILCYLVDGEKSVGEIAEYLDMRDSSASQQLALLRGTGVVAARREGQTVWYSLRSAQARALLETLYGLYCTTVPICAGQKKTPARTKGKRK